MCEAEKCVSEHDHNRHDHGHSHEEGHGHGNHEQGHAHGHKSGPEQADEILVIRPSSGLAGDMMVAGLVRMANIEQTELDALVASIGLSALEGNVILERRQVSGVNGWTVKVTLPPEHAHRTLPDIVTIINQSDMGATTQHLAKSVFALLAEAEGRVHGISTEEVTFHEVGALDSILDICLACILFDRLSPGLLVCGPLPLCDGTVQCSHGILSTPVPAVLELLGDTPVCGIPSRGETVTPTAIALLKGLGAQFGPWPGLTVRRTALVYGTRELPGVSNGAIFSWGTARGASLHKMCLSA